MTARNEIDQVVLYDTCLKAFTKLVRMDEQDERVFGVRPVRPSHTAERLGVERYLRTYCAIAGEDYEPWHDKITRMYDTMRYHEVDINVRHVRQDIVDNFLYQEYLDQLEDEDAIRSFSCYSMFVTAKAVITLLTEHMMEVGSALPIRREDALAFKARDDYDETDPVWYLSHVFQDVPGTWEAVQTLQSMYGAVVRLECDIQDIPVAGLLPDDPIGDSIVSEDVDDMPLRIDQAIQAFLADEGPADTIAQIYGIGQKRFRKILRDGGYMRSHGGDRKGKRKN